MHSKNKLAFAVLAIALAIFSSVAFALPDGTTVTVGTPQTKEFFSSAIVGALGGDNTNLTVNAQTQTVAWQGFFGDVLGNITLQDASGSDLFSWLDTSAGTVFTSRDSAIDFSSITAQNDCTIDEILTGTNSDRVNSTFTQSSNSELIISGTTTIVAGSACATNTFINSTSQTGSFEEIILTDDAGTTSIYATKLENAITGFDGLPHDFQMIVPDFANQSTTTYYFYAEIQ